MNTGFFTIDVISEMNAAKDLAEAREIAIRAINSQPKARSSNIKKATDAVNKASTKDKLLIAASNFMLAHPSENLGMNKE